MRYYCLHHKPAIDRKNYLEKVFSEQEIEVEWIEDFLPTCDEVINHPKVPSKEPFNVERHGGFLCDAEISLYLKHLLAIKKICDINDYGIIFEDDIKRIDFKLTEVLPSFIEIVEESDIDILWIGSTPNHFVELKDYGNIRVVCGEYTKRSRLAHCYMLHSNLAKKIYDAYAEIKHPADLQWDYIIKKFNLKSGWTRPCIYQRTDLRETPSLIR